MSADNKTAAMPAPMPMRPPVSTSPITRFWNEFDLKHPNFIRWTRGSAIPPIPGPKIGPFDTRGQPLDLTFVKELGHGVDSRVWEVRINGKRYALKIFSYGSLGPNTRQGMDAWTPEEYHYYREPFYNECRVFGRLQETGNEDLSIKCYGYLLLGHEWDEWLDEVWWTTTDDTRGKEHGWPSWARNPLEKDQPVKCLVKELVDTTPDIEPAMFPRIIKDMHKYHSLGIWVDDVRLNNYANGKLFDFSRAITTPHPKATPDDIEWLQERTGVHEGPIGDEDMVDSAIEDVLFRTFRRDDFPFVPRMQANHDYLRRLRSWYKPSPPKPPYWSRVRPELYDWHAVGRRVTRSQTKRRRVQRSKASHK